MNLERYTQKGRLKRLSSLKPGAGKIRFRFIQTPEQIARQKKNKKARQSRKMNRQRGN